MIFMITFFDINQIKSIKYIIYSEQYNGLNLLINRKFNFENDTKNVLTSYVKYPRWHNFPLEKTFSQACKKSVTLTYVQTRLA